MYRSFIVCVCNVLSTSLHLFLFCIESIIIIVCLNFRFYSLDILDRSSLNNMVLYLSFSLLYTMNVNDVLYSVITIYYMNRIRDHVYSVCAACMCRYLVRCFSHLLAMHQEISLSKIVYF